MRAGGQGAPLAPYFHEYISIKEKPFVNILNLGGFSNWTFKSDNKLMAYDTGPANYLIDLISNKYFDVPYDKNGLLAKKGKINDKAYLLCYQIDFLTKKFLKALVLKGLILNGLQNSKISLN
jgi:anhydro-N-acetylmuramic acid kinase